MCKVKGALNNEEITIFGIIVELRLKWADLMHKINYLMVA